MNEINVEKIMEEIRKDIEKKGYKESDLSFDDIHGETTGNSLTVFEASQLERLMSQANASTRVDFYHPIVEKGIKGLIKKVIRKAVKPLLFPICQNQEAYNAMLIQIINQMYLYAKQQERRIADLEAIVSREEE